MIRRTAEELHEILVRIFTAAGAPHGHAETIAEHLVASELAGVETHGIRPLFKYFEDIRSGQLLPDAQPAILEESETSALVSGHWSFGQVAAKFGMEVAIEKAKKSNIAIVSVVQLHHIGRVGHYGEMAAAAGMAGIVAGAGYCRPAPRAAPYGGRIPIMDTNPISIAFPNPHEPDGRPVLLDYATTMRAHGAVYLARIRGQQLPPHVVIDKDGNPSTDPNELEHGGALLPFGTYKGYALMVAAEFLGRVFTGADEHIDPRHGDDMFRHQGITMIAIKADLFRPLEAFARDAHRTAQQIRAIPPAPGFDRVRVPGDPEAEARAERQRDGIPIAEDLWQMVKENAATVGVEVE